MVFPEESLFADKKSFSKLFSMKRIIISSSEIGVIWTLIAFFWPILGLLKSRPYSLNPEFSSIHLSIKLIIGDENGMKSLISFPTTILELVLKKSSPEIFIMVIFFCKFIITNGKVIEFTIWWYVSVCIFI